MSIRISLIRIDGFRGLKNVEVELEGITVLTGMNNTGKTTFLKALQIVFGNRMFISSDDFCIADSETSNQITIDLKIIPVDAAGNAIPNFSEDWEILFSKDNRIKVNAAGDSFVPLRTVVNFDPIKNSFKTKQYILQEWPLFESEGSSWLAADNGTEKAFSFEEIPFYYVEAQRDIVEDIKFKTSYLGRMISKIEYEDDEIVKAIEDQIEALNEEAVTKSDILLNIRTTLKELDSAMDSKSKGVEITPFTKKLRDLSKGLSIYYSDREDSFSMEYHGMGTRSWSSLLVLKSFISVLSQKALAEGQPFFPIVAVEEPEAHLHPNAQKKLFGQIEQITGQTIISTHSSYIAASAELRQIRGIYKGPESITFGKINVSDFSDEDLRKIDRQVINTRGDIFFAKILIFCEGETEEQALPIFADKHFGIKSIETGIDFIGVGSFGNYLPFLRVAEAFGIPWFIFSDAEPSTVTSVSNQFNSSGSSREEAAAVTYLGAGNKFETQLIADGYNEEIRSAILKIELEKCTTLQHRNAKEIEINAYTEAQLLQYMYNAKASMGPAVAHEIVKSGKALPPHVVNIFNKAIPPKVEPKAAT